MVLRLFYTRNASPFKVPNLPPPNNSGCHVLKPYRPGPPEKYLVVVGSSNDLPGSILCRPGER